MEIVKCETCPHLLITVLMKACLFPYNSFKRIFLLGQKYNLKDFCLEAKNYKEASSTAQCEA